MKPIPRRNAMLVGLALLVIVSAGCTGGETDPRPGSGQVGIYIEEWNLSGPEYFINATVDFSLNVEESVAFDHVMLCLYDSEGNVVKATDVGTLTSPSDRENVNVSINQRPDYIVVDHPRFEDYSTIGPAILSGEDDYMRVQPSELPFEYPRNDEIGECR